MPNIEYEIGDERDAFDDEYEIDDDYDSDFEDKIIYQPEEPSLNRFCIVLCELYNPLIHGPTEKGSPLINHYLVNHRFRLYNSGFINGIANFQNDMYSSLVRKNVRAVQRHPIYRNYKTIIAKDSYIKAEIAECILLPTNECVAVIKTFWIKIIQRTWKKIHSLIKQTISLRKNISSLRYREIYGRWPSTCSYMPKLKGMLSK